MKIAIYEPLPRICGPVTWAGHLRTGFRKNGHECDIVTTTKSGRPSSKWGEQNKYIYGLLWSPILPDRTFKFPGRELDEYDLIILTEPRCSPQDREVFFGRVKKSLPTYIEVLGGLKKAPWVTALHGWQYGEKLSPYLQNLLATPTFLNHALALSRDHVDHRFKEAGVHVAVLPALPYEPKREIDSPVPNPQNPTVGLSGRLVSNKGPQLLTLLACEGLIKCDVELWGASTVSKGPSPVNDIYDLARNYGFEGELDDKRMVFKPHRWKVEKGEQRIEYHGNYSDPVAMSERLTAQISFTSFGVNVMLEFVCLEALDAGCVGIYPEHLVPPTIPYDVFPFEFKTNAPSISRGGIIKKKVDLELLKPVTSLINTAVELPYAERMRMAKTNREILRDVHDPQKFARAFLGLL